MSFTETTPPATEANEPETIDQLREAASRGKAAQGERDQAIAARDAALRETAMVKAGIDTDTKIGQLFAASYEGELDVEAIKAAWAELGVAPKPEGETPTEPQVSEAEAAQTKAREALAAGEGGAPPAEEPADPMTAGMASFNEKLAGGATRRGASSEVFRRVIDAGGKGDERVVWNGWTDDELRDAKEATR